MDSFLPPFSSGTEGKRKEEEVAKPQAKRTGYNKHSHKPYLPYQPEGEGQADPVDGGEDLQLQLKELHQW